MIYFASKLKTKVKHDVTEEVDEILKILNMEGKSELPCRLLSLEDRRKLALTEAVISNPGVLILDDPFRDLQRESAAQVAKLLKSFT